jgi:broad specificity phosphatase PhoE
VLILVRHAMPAIDPAVPPAQWHLGPEGLVAAARLRLPAGALLVASAESKAQQTLAHAGPVVADPGFNEVTRENEPWDGPFRELRRSYVEGSQHPGWELQSAVVARFEAGVKAWLAKAGSRDLVVATHGMAMTVWLRSRGYVKDPGEFWAALKFPDLVPV